MQRRVVITAPAENDLAQIHGYLADTVSAQRADAELDRLLRTGRSLSSLSKRGKPSDVLAQMGAPDYREMLSGSYRIFYRVTDDFVLVAAIIHVSRDVHRMLRRRLRS